MGDWRVELEIRARLKRSAGWRAVVCGGGSSLREGKGWARLAAAEEANGMK